MRQFRMPFRNMTSAGWVNLAVAALLASYVIQVLLDIVWGNVFGNLGVDFASFWSAGRIANQSGYAAVYDLDRMAQVQRQLLPPRASAVADLGVIPTPYLPVFLLPFQLLAWLPPTFAAGLWILLNLAGTVLYLRSFAFRLTGRALDRRLLILLMASAPVFLNLFSGQVNLWLMICIGESFLAATSGKPFRSGLWMAGLLLKPQTLVLIVPAVLLQRCARTAWGMLAGGAGILGASWLLAGTDALLRLVQLWLGYAGGLPTNDPQLMMNWRMIGFHLAVFLGSRPANMVMIVGMAVTFAAALAMWIRRRSSRRPEFVFAGVGLLAATQLVAWHSHVHMAMLLIPLLLTAALTHRKQTRSLLEWWTVLPASLYVLRLILASVMHIGLFGDAPYGLLDFLAGVGEFTMNLVLVIWALRLLRPLASSPVQPYTEA